MVWRLRSPSVYLAHLLTASFTGNSRGWGGGSYALTPCCLPTSHHLTLFTSTLATSPKHLASQLCPWMWGKSSHLLSAITFYMDIDKHTSHLKMHYRKFQDFPGGTVVKNLPTIAGHGFNPWLGKIPHVTEQLSPCVTTTKPMCSNYWSQCVPEPVLCNKRSHCRDVHDGPMVKTGCFQCRGCGFDPWSRSHCNEKPSYCNKE